MPALLDVSVLGTGFFLAASLLVAIGAQNAFVLRQGLRREHVLAVVLACSLYDWLLIGAGMAGLGALVHGYPGLARAMALLGAAFIAGYGVFAFWRALHPQTLLADRAGASLSLGAALAQCTAFTFLNPHVYLDTVLLIGSVGAQQASASRTPFYFGAGLASTAWFFSLGFGARLLAPFFARPVAWRILDAAVGVTMFLIAFLLLRG